MRASDFLGPLGPLAHRVEGYELRSSQLAMADTVERALEGDGIALIEAGTGTGKTLAYLVPALLSDRKIVISTGTKTLQDQIMEHDLPLLRQYLPVVPDVAVLKGIGNYLCQRRFAEFVQGSAAVEGAAADGVDTLTAWQDATKTGDRAELSALPEDHALWNHVLSSSETRIGARCSHYEDCFVTKARRRAEDAQIVVVNHHLFFADLATRQPHGGGVLPPYDAVIFDEAHQIEDVATQFFGVQVSSTKIEVLLRDAERSLAAVKATDGVASIASNVRQCAAQFFGVLPQGGGPDRGRTAITPEVMSGPVKAEMLKLDAALETLAEHCKVKAAKAESIAQIARRAGKIRDDVATIIEGTSGTHVTWIETRGRRVLLGASPIDVSTILRDELFMRGGAVVMTSATLSTGTSFEYTKRRLGIDIEIDEAILPSPFDYETQAALYLPGHMPDPRSAGFLDAATDESLALLRLTGGGAFVLCTSFRVMHALADRCRGEIPFPVFVQGDAPKGVLLDRFRGSPNAVLFATASFWEGVDVPGDGLRLVIIDKLPFDVPTDPLIVARCDRLKEEGIQPFMKYLVPAAAIGLKQGFGRLIRTRRDRGIVAILDSRIVTKGYGKVFLRSLPPAARCTSLQQVTDFWRRATSGADPSTDAVCETQAAGPPDRAGNEGARTPLAETTTDPT